MSEMMKSKYEWKLGIVFLLVSIIFVSVFSFTSSPLYVAYGCDQEIFRMLGRLSLKGLTPYKDFFDHKGPFTFTVQWLGCLISKERIGIMTVQVLFLFCSLFLMFKIFLLKYSRKMSLILTAIILLILKIFYEGGNSVEEFCLPFLLLTAYCFCKFCIIDKQNKLEHSVKYSIAYGITIAVCMYTRLTNVFPLIAIVLVGLVYLIKNKLWKNLIINMFGVIGGIAIISLPYFIYFYIKGALYDMFFATFIYNIRHGGDYSDLSSTGELVKLILYMLILVCTLIMGIYAIRKKKNELIGYSVVIMSIIGMVMHMKMRFYLHYYIIYIPIIIMSILCVKGIYTDFKNKNLNIYSRITLVVIVLMIAFFGIKTVSNSIDVVRVIKNQKATAINNNYMLDIIDGIDKKESILAYQVTPKFYIVTDTYPCYKNFILQDQHTEYDEDVREGFEKDIKSLKAKYIVAPKRERKRYLPFIKKHYVLKKENKNLYLYERQ